MRIITPKGHSSEGSFLRRVITQKGRFSENTFMVMFDTNLRPFNRRNLLRCLWRVFTPCQKLSIAGEKTKKFQLWEELSPDLWRKSRKLAFFNFRPFLDEICFWFHRCVFAPFRDLCEKKRKFQPRAELLPDLWRKNRKKYHFLASSYIHGFIESTWNMRRTRKLEKYRF